MAPFSGSSLMCAIIFIIIINNSNAHWLFVGYLQIVQSNTIQIKIHESKTCSLLLIITVRAVIVTLIPVSFYFIRSVFVRFSFVEFGSVLNEFNCRMILITFGIMTCSVYFFLLRFIEWTWKWKCFRFDWIMGFRHCIQFVHRGSWILRKTELQWKEEWTEQNGRQFRCLEMLIELDIFMVSRCVHIQYGICNTYRHIRPRNEDRKSSSPRFFPSVYYVPHIKHRGPHFMKNCFEFWIMNLSNS